MSMRVYKMDNNVFLLQHYLQSLMASLYYRFGSGNVLKIRYELSIKTGCGRTKNIKKQCQIKSVTTLQTISFNWHF